MKSDHTAKDDNLSATYEITVEGKLDARWADWFNGMTVTTREVSKALVLTTLTGTIRDQSALRGILSRIWDLGLTLCSVARLDDN
jgi:hypothetical protein